MAETSRKIATSMFKWHGAKSVVFFFTEMISQYKLKHAKIHVVLFCKILVKTNFAYFKS